MSHVIRSRGLVAGSGMTLLLCVAHAANDLLTGTLGVLLPMLEVKFAAGPIMLALLVGTLSVSASLTQPFLGTLAERTGMRSVTGFGLALTTFSLSLTGVTNSIGLLLIVLGLGGLGSAALHPAATSVVGGRTSRRPGLSIAFFTAGGMMGAAAGPIVIQALVARNGPAGTIWLLAPGLVLAVALLALLPTWEPHARASVRRRSPSTAGPSILVRRLTLISLVASLALITFSSSVPLWLVSARGLRADDPLLAWTLTTFALSAGAGAIAGGVLAQRVRSNTLTCVTLLLAALALSSVYVLPTGRGTLVAAGLGAALLYVSQPVLIVRAQEADPVAPARAAGVVGGVGTGLAGLLYIGVGLGQQAFGLRTAGAIVFLLLVPTAYLANRWLEAPPPVRHAPVEESTDVCSPVLPAGRPRSSRSPQAQDPLDRPGLCGVTTDYLWQPDPTEVPPDRNEE